jgi:predicted RNA-binding Zn-ribbon protein involved in translation (DUF1610 family)
MNHLTAHLYEQDDDTLVIYRCPVCGSTGEGGSRCPGHDSPTADGDWHGPKRKPVPVPRVGEEPRCDEKVALVKGRLERYADTLEMEVPDKEALIRTLREGALALDHFTQQPGGGDADVGMDRGLGGAGGSGQGAGSALEQLLGWVEETHLRRQRASEDESARREFRAADRGAAVALEDVGVRIRQLLTQHPSGGQEGGLTDRASNRDGSSVPNQFQQEGRVEEGAERVPDAVAFRCPRCGAEMANETAGGAVVAKPPTCAIFHPPTEMEQGFLGEDAYRGDQS